MLAIARSNFDVDVSLANFANLFSASNTSINWFFVIFDFLAAMVTMEPYGEDLFDFY